MNEIVGNIVGILLLISPVIVVAGITVYYDYQKRKIK
jgi:hypothetical protein